MLRSPPLRARLTVPSRHREALTALASLSGAELDVLLKRLEAAQPTEESLQDAVATVDVPLAFEALMAAAMFRSSHGLGVASAAEDIVGSLGIEESSSSLERILSDERLISAAKVLDLRSTYERVVHVSRVVTDVRPLFDDSANPEVLGSTIVHTLELTTFGTKGLEDWFAAVDEDDLQSLKTQIERALAKSGKLRQALSATPVRVVGESGASHEHR